MDDKNQGDLSSNHPRFRPEVRKSTLESAVKIIGIKNCFVTTRNRNADSNIMTKSVKFGKLKHEIGENELSRNRRRKYRILIVWQTEFIFLGTNGVGI